MSVEELLAKLARSESAFAHSYLEYRGREYAPGKLLSVDDARANAVLFMETRGIELPEVIRFRLHALLAIQRAVEPT